MASECDTKELAAMIHSRVMQEATLMSSSTIQSISTTLNAAARHLNEVWNSRQPLFKLPPELLQRIVNEALPWILEKASHHYKTPVWRSTARTTEALLPISHTCRWLRQVVIDDPTLWRSIATNNRPFIELCLSRSGTTGPFTLMLSPRGNPPRMLAADSFQHLSHLAPRLQELHLLFCIKDGSQAPGFKAFLEPSLPYLQYFSLTGLALRMNWNDWDGSLPLSGHNAPNLRHLHLEMTVKLPTESPFPHLTHLCLSDLATNDLNNTANILRNCPALTSLVLRNVASRARFFTTQSVSDYYMNTPNPPNLTNLSRVIFVGMEWFAVQYFALLFSRQCPCIQLSPKGLIQVYPVDVFESLYHQCADTYRDEEADAPQLSIAIHAYEDSSCGIVTALFVMLTTATRLLRITLCPRLLGNSYSKLINGRWRDHALAPLRTLPSLREVWLADTDTDTDAHSASAPLWDFPTPGGGQEPAVAFPALESVIVVYDCSAPLRRLHPGALASRGVIQPSIGALPKGRAGGPTTTAPNLACVHLAIGYDAADLPRLRETWHSVFPGGGGLGRVDLSAKLLRELASGEYAYVRRARLVVQLMPHFVLDAGELERVREHFVEVEVEEIERLPTVRVPDRVRDDALNPEGFIPNSVLC